MKQRVVLDPAELPDGWEQWPVVRDETIKLPGTQTTPPLDDHQIERRNGATTVMTCDLSLPCDWITPKGILVRAHGTRYYYVTEEDAS